MKLRQGRKNPHNLYLQTGDEPSNDDLSVGYIRFPRVAQAICDAMNGGVVRSSFVVDAEWQRAEELRESRLGPGQDDIPKVNDGERPSSTLG